jgi:hypothetical protein
MKLNLKALYSCPLERNLEMAMWGLSYEKSALISHSLAAELSIFFCGVLDPGFQTKISIRG